MFTLLLSLGSFVPAPASWAQQHHGHSHLPPQGAAHDHRFNNIDQTVKMFESAERDTLQKPDEVVKQLQLRTGNVVADIGAGTGYFIPPFCRCCWATGKSARA